MYPPSAQYSLLPTDPEDINTPLDADDIDVAAPLQFQKRNSISQRLSSLRTRRFGLLIAGSVAVFLFAGIYWSRVFRRTIALPNPDNAFMFDPETRPAWVDSPPAEPLVLRVAVITRVDGYERRQVIRDAVFKGVRKEDVTLEYRFFVGAASDNEQGRKVHQLVEEENQKFNDIVVLDKIDDIPDRLSEKRYAALKWAGSVSNATYDYFMTIDSDTFVRFAPLARRLPELYGDRKVNPREEPVLIGRMASHLTYFLPNVTDGNKDSAEEDEYVKGPWFLYPAGIGYMLSSSLVHTMLSTDPPLPHHIHYPSDDVMIGAWIASLRLFHDTSIAWSSTPEHSPLPVHPVHPRPFLPYVVDTRILDDTKGWHDFLGRGGHDAVVGWESACVHHLEAGEMRMMRERLEVLGEWDV